MTCDQSEAYRQLHYIEEALGNALYGYAPDSNEPSWKDRGAVELAAEAATKLAELKESDDASHVPVYTMDALQAYIHGWSRSKGWWEGAERNFPEMLALIHSEISECLEEYRRDGLARGVWYSEKDGVQKPEGVFIELADAVIRILDLFGHYGISLEEMIRVKMAYNETRPYRHGNKLA